MRCNDCGTVKRKSTALTDSVKRKSSYEMLLNKEFTMDYKDGTLHGKILKKIRDIRQPYYVGKDQTIYVQWCGQ